VPEAVEEVKRRRKEALCPAFYFQGGCVCGERTVGCKAMFLSLIIQFS